MEIVKFRIKLKYIPQTILITFLTKTAMSKQERPPAPRPQPTPSQNPDRGEKGSNNIPPHRSPPPPPPKTK